MLKNISRFGAKRGIFLDGDILANKIIEWLDMSKNIL